MSKTPLRLKGRIALVTGSTSGIGLAIAKRLAKDGATVIVSSRKKENVDTTLKYFNQNKYNALGVVCHIGNPEDRKKLVKEVEKLGVLDIFVQCAGANPYIGPILECPDNLWDKTFDTNLKSTFQLTKELMHLLQKSKCGRIIYNSSLSAYAPYEVLGAYSVSKVALIAFTKTAALNLGRYKITVNCIVPGVIDTPFGDVMIQDKFVMQILQDFSAMKRSGTPEEVAGIVGFLASEDSSYITGEAICISGGLLSRL